MYLDFYKLREKPFTLSPDPKYLYYSKSHEEAMSQFVFSISEQAGIIVLTGEVGTGKTTLINTFKRDIPQNCIVASINHKIFSTKGLLQNICKQYDIEFSRDTTAELLLKLQNYLEKINKEGKQAILILDEAHTLTKNLLEDVRILSNFEAYNKKYLNILLLGQPELNEILKSFNLRPLKDRITQKYHLKPLSFEETNDYINHRLSVAGYSGSDLITGGAIQKIYEFSKGIPRKINIIADKSLLMGYVTNSQYIDTEIIIRVKYDDFFDELEEAPNKNNDKYNLDKAKSQNSAEVPESEFSEPLLNTKTTLPGKDFWQSDVTVTNEELKHLLEKMLVQVERISNSKIIKLQNLPLSKKLIVSSLLIVMFLIAQFLSILVYNILGHF